MAPPRFVPSKGLGRIKPDPYDCHQLRRVTCEPGIVKVLAGAGFACDGRIYALTRPHTRTAPDNVLQHGRDLEGTLLGCRHGPVITQSGEVLRREHHNRRLGGRLA